MEHFLTEQEKSGSVISSTQIVGDIFCLENGQTFSMVWKDTQMWQTSKQAWRAEFGEQTEIYTW